MALKDPQAANKIKNAVLSKRKNKLSNKPGPDKYSNFMENHQILILNSEMYVILIKFIWPWFIWQLVKGEQEDEQIQRLKLNP